MLKIAVICTLAASMILALCSCFVKKSKHGFFAQILFYLSLLGLGVTLAGYKNAFSTYTWVLILSVLPQFLSIWDLPKSIKTKKDAVLQSEENFLNLDSNEDETDEGDAEEKKPLKIKKHTFLDSNGMLLDATSCLLSAACLGFCSLYLGMETFYGFLIGLFFACAITCIMLALNKISNPYDALSIFLAMMATGIALGEILTVLLYAQSVKNLVFCGGLLLFAIYAWLHGNGKSNSHLIYYLSVLALFATILL